MFESGLPVWFSHHVGSRLVGRKGGFNRDVAEVYAQKQAAEFISPEALQAQQLRKLVTLLKHAQAHSPYYTELFRTAGLDPDRVRSVADLQVLPPLSKTDLIAHRDRMVSSRHAIADLNLNSTGGSTGLTVNFYQDRNWLVHQVAGGQFFDSLAGWRPGARTAYLWGAPSDNDRAKEGWKAHVKAVLSNTRVYDSFDMSATRMARYHEQLTKFRPDVMVCYAGSVHLFAQYLLEQKLRPAYPLKSIVTSAETLTDAMRTTIESAFQVPVFNRYGSREVGVIGAECDAHAGLHVNELDMVVEATPGPDGHGELLVTNLNNFGMPLIRYRIGDVGQIDTAPCRCGRAGARITRLFGRSSDFFTNTEGRKIHGEYFTHLFYGLDGIARFQLVQETLSEFQLKIVRNPDHWQDSTERFLRDELRKVFGDSMQLQIDHVDGIPATASGKFRFTISKV